MVRNARHRFAWWLMISTVAILLSTALIPLIPADKWWIRIGDFPRLQLLIAYLVALPLLWFFRRQKGVRIAAAALVVSCLIQFYWIRSYLPLATPQVEASSSNAPDKQLRVMSANVLETNTNASALLQLVAEQKPDLLVLCEVNHRWAEDTESLKDEFKSHFVHPQENGYGIALYSQLDMTRCELRTMIRESVPSIDADIIMRNGQKVRVFAVHPKPPRPGTDTTGRDAELILVGREVRDDPSVIVLGDLNDVGWSRTSNLFREMSQLLDPRIGRGFYATFDATSWFMRYPLDYVFHSDDFRVAEMKVLPSIGSDHFPLWIQLSHEPGAVDSKSAPDLDSGDREDAEDAIEAAKNKSQT